MKIIGKLAILASAGLMLGLGPGIPSAHAGTHVSIRVGIAPPPPRWEPIPAPRAGLVWARGFWRWNGAAYIWVGGRWYPQRVGYRYVHPRWHHVRGGWRFAPGHWNHAPRHRVHWDRGHRHGHHGWRHSHGHHGRGH